MQVNNANWDYCAGSYSCRELIKTRDVYSSNNDVLERLRDSLLGQEKAKAVPRDDLLSAPISANIQDCHDEN